MSATTKGTVTLEVGGKAYTLCLTLNALCELEDLLSTPKEQVTFQQVTAMAEKGSLRHIRAVIWAALRDHHPEMSLRDAGQLIQDIGMGAMTAHLTDLAASMAPDEEDAKELAHATAGRKRPRKAQVV